MKLNRLVCLIIFVLLLSACSGPDDGSQPSISNGHSTPEVQSDPMKETIEQRCKEITSMYYHLYASADKKEPQNQWDDPVMSQSSIDAIENLLIDAGYDVMDTNGPYPSYLTTADSFYEFWECVQQKKSAEQEIISIMESGGIAYQLIIFDSEKAYLYSMRYGFDEITDLNYEKHEILDWEVTEKGNFYYRIYPADDKHYADFSLVRLAEPNLVLYDLNMKYIWAGGYIGTNMFLTDWTEDDFAQLSFNDLWEYLYHDYHGEYVSNDAYAFIPERYCYQIPAEEFEEVILQYFTIDIDTLRQVAQYNAEGDYYPWRPIETNDYVFLYYYTVESEVTAYRGNSDGTITLTVEMLSTDLATDCLFAHEVTVRPLENGNFQYISNKVTYQTEYGLPFCEPRLTWGPSK